MVVGRDGDALDALVLWFGGSWSFGFLGFLFYLIRTEGFPGVYVGLLGYFFLGCRVSFFSPFPLFVGLLDFLFSFLVLGAQGF